MDVLQRADEATWFEWKGGSAPVFWRWHDFSIEARDGFPAHFLDDTLRSARKKFCKPAVPANAATKRLIEEKLNRISQVRYLGEGYVHWDIRFFAVPKGDEDI